MNYKFSRTIRLVILHLMLLLLISGVESKAGETTDIPNVLGRNHRLNDLCDDFEDVNWYFDYDKRESNNGLWKANTGDNDKGEPEILKRVSPPAGGIIGSTGALVIQTNIPEKVVDKNKDQEDSESTGTGQHKLSREKQPVFIVRVYLPPFAEWGDYYSFGFRILAYGNAPHDTPAVPSIWIRYEGKIKGAHFYFRIFDKQGMPVEVIGKPIKQYGWWTLAIAFDQNGNSRFYAKPGVEPLSNSDKMFDTNNNNLLIDYIGHSFFSLGYTNGNLSPRIVVDDYEVWEE
ncbi:MAG: hypothetical protein ABIG46_01910 [Candidatus Omnitrophota bacterium]